MPKAAAVYLGGADDLAGVIAGGQYYSRAAPDCVPGRTHG